MSSETLQNARERRRERMKQIARTADARSIFLSDDSSQSLNAVIEQQTAIQNARTASTRPHTTQKKPHIITLIISMIFYLMCLYFIFTACVRHGLLKDPLLRIHFLILTSLFIIYKIITRSL